MNVQSIVNGVFGWFEIYKFVGEHTCGIEHVTGTKKNVTVDTIASVCLNFFIDDKGPSLKEIDRIIFKDLCCKLGYSKCWIRGVNAKNTI